MKIAVVGCGALGSYYGGKLCRARHEVHFLLRSDYDIVRRQGVRVLSPEGDFHFQPRCASDPATIGACDLVIVGLKTTANGEFPRLLPPLVAPRTTVLTLQNGLGNEEALARLFPAEQILGGLCFVCLNRTAPGVIQHIAQGKIVLGEYRRWPEPRTHDLASVFRAAGIPCAVRDSLEQARWQKLVWNIPFNGLGVAAAAGIEVFEGSDGSNRIQRPLGPCWPTDRLLADALWLPLVRELMLEVLAVGATKGLKLAPDYADQEIKRTLPFGAYRASTLVDFEAGRPLELESLFREPLRQAQAAGVPVPRLERLCRVLEALDALRPAIPASGSS